MNSYNKLMSSLAVAGYQPNLIKDNDKINKSIGPELINQK